jgi:hypothetical protein
MAARPRTRTFICMANRLLDPFAVGSYLTDGTTLLGIVGELPQDRSLRLVENAARSK